MENLLNPFTGMMVGIGMFVLGLLGWVTGATFASQRWDSPVIANSVRGTIFGLMVLAGSFGHHMYDQQMFALTSFAVMWGIVGLYLTILLCFEASRQWVIVIPLTIATLFTVSFFPKGTWGMYISVLCTCVGLQTQGVINF